MFNIGDRVIVKSGYGELFNNKTATISGLLESKLYPYLLSFDDENIYHMNDQAWSDEELILLTPEIEEHKFIVDIKAQIDKYCLDHNMTNTKKICNVLISYLVGGE